MLTLGDLAEATGIPLALLKALEAEGLLIPARVAGQERYTEEDVDASRAGLRLLEWGIPLTDLLDLARRHNEATEATARQAVELFARHVRDPLRSGSRPDALAHGDAGRRADDAVDGLLQAYAELLPAVNTLVGHHFTRTLVRVALDHVEQRGLGPGARGGLGPHPRRGGSRRGADAGRRRHREDRSMTGTTADPARRRTAVRRPPSASPSRPPPGPATPTSPRAPRRPSSSDRCSTPSPPATTWSTAR